MPCLYEIFNRCIRAILSHSVMSLVNFQAARVTSHCLKRKRLWQRHEYLNNKSITCHISPNLRTFMKDKKLNSLAFFTWSSRYLEELKNKNFRVLSDYHPTSQTREKLTLFGLFGKIRDYRKLKVVYTLYAHTLAID